MYAGDIQEKASPDPTSLIQSGAATGTRPTDSYRLDPLAASSGIVGQGFSLSIAFWHLDGAGTLIGLNTGGTSQPNRYLNINIGADGRVALLVRPSSGASTTLATTVAPASGA